MISKCKILVLFLALGVFAAPETITKSSASFSFKQGVGVLFPMGYSANGNSFYYKKIAVGKPGMAFSWVLPKEKDVPGKLSIFSLSGRLVKSFDLSKAKGSINWTMQNSKISGGIYFAKLSYGSFNKSLKIIY